MDDLISRKAALEAVKIPNGEYGNPSERHGIIIARVEASRRIMDIPSVEAVPLEPLCQWLAGYEVPPNYALDEVRDDSIDPESLVYTANDRAKAWAFHFRELMKSGLIDTEESNAEKKGNSRCHNYPLG